MKVFVYYNLHKHTWSIKAMEGDNYGRVIGHADYVILDDAIGRVSQAGRERVLRERVKNVHAGVVGQLRFAGDRPVQSSTEGLTAITYNPYKYSSFVIAASETPWHGSSRAYMDNRKVFVTNH